MSYNDYLENIPKKEMDKMLKNISYRLKTLEHPSVDAQTIMFWHLQLQFLSGSFTEIQLLTLLRGTKNYDTLNTLRYNGDWEEYKMELATHLALQLSGIEE